MHYFHFITFAKVYLVEYRECGYQKIIPDKYAGEVRELQ